MSATGAAIPSARLPLSASAPGKAIVFGEHAVVHGQPELLFALDLRLQLVFAASDVAMINGRRADAATNPYLATGLRELDPTGVPVAITSVSRIPRGSGLGSSAAFVAALATGLSAVRGGVDRASLAQRAFDIERRAQGVGSPGDTSAVVAGGFLAINGEVGTPLWEVTDGTRNWNVRRIPDPGWNWVVAFSRTPHATGPAVRAVSTRLGAPDGPALLEEFRRVAVGGIGAVREEDRAATGRWLGENQRLLETVGVGTPRLQELLTVASEGAAGAKITGAGMGGSILVLPQPGEEIRIRGRLARAGADAFVVRPTLDGARLL